MGHFEKVFGLVQANLFLRNHSQILRHPLTACLRFGLSESLYLNGSAVGTFAFFLRKLSHMGSIGAKTAETAEAEVVILVEVIVLQAFGRVLALGLKLTLLGLYVTRLWVARMHLVGIITRQDKVFDFQLLLIEHGLEVLDLL